MASMAFRAGAAMGGQEYLYRSAHAKLKEVLLAGYVQGVSSSDDSKGLSSDGLLFKDIKLKPSFFENLSLPLRVEHGKIGEIFTDLDIPSLFFKGRAAEEVKGQTIHVILKNVEIHVTPNNHSKAAYKEMFKSLNLLLEDLFHNSFQENTNGFWDLVHLVELEVVDLQIVYEDPHEDFQLILALEHLEKKSAKSKRKARKKRVKKEKRKGEDATEDDSSDNAAVTVLEIANMSMKHNRIVNGEQEEKVVMQPVSYVINILHEYIPSADEADQLKKKKRKKPKMDKVDPEQLWGVSFYVVALDRLELALTPLTLQDVTSAFMKTCAPLFDDLKEETSTQHLDLLRWYPVHGHSGDYWKYCLRSVLPHVIHKVAQRQKIRMPDEWANVYGLMSPEGHKERYILLYQRSLNLVSMEPLSNLEDAELNELEGAHATATLVLWRTEARIRLAKERPDPTSRVPRKTMGEIKRGVLGAVLQVYQNTIPSIVLTDHDKRRAYRDAMIFLRSSMLAKVMEGCNVSLVCGSDSGGFKINLEDGDDCISLLMDEMNLEFDYNIERTLVQLIANGFREKRMGGVQKLFAHASRDGRVDLFSRFPHLHEDVRAEDSRFITALFVQHLDIVNVNLIAESVRKFFFAPVEKAQKKLKEDDGTEEKEDEEDGVGRTYKEIGFDLTIADSVIRYHVGSSAGYGVRMEMRLGEPEPEEYREPDNVPNLKVEMTMKPRSHFMDAKIHLHDFTTSWSKYKLKGTKGKADQSFTEPLINHVGDMKFVAQVERFNTTDGSEVEEFNFSCALDKGSFVVSQNSLAELLQVVSTRLEEAHVKGRGRKSVEWKPPFSHRTYLHGMDMEPYEEKKNEDSEEKDAKPLVAFLLSVAGLYLKTTEKREIEDSKDREADAVEGPRELFDHFSSKLMDHLLDGVLSTSVSSTLAKEAITRNLSLAPLVQGMRLSILNGAPWDASLVESVRVMGSQVLLWDVLQTDNHRFHGASFGQAELSLPQGLSEVFLDAYFMHKETILGDERAATGKLSIEERNPDYLQITLHDFEWHENKLLAGILNPVLTEANLTNPSELCDEIEEGLDLEWMGEHEKVTYPPFGDGSFKFTMNTVTLKLTAAGHKIAQLKFSGVGSHVLNKAGRRGRAADPDVIFDSFRGQFDAQLLKGAVQNLLENSKMGVFSSSLQNIRSSLLTFFIAAHKHAVSLKADTERLDSPAEIELQNFKWAFKSRSDKDVQFNSSGKMLCALPYSLLSGLATDADFCILIRTTLELSASKRTVALERVHEFDRDDENSDEDSDDDLESDRWFLSGTAREFEVSHVAPAQWKPPSSVKLALTRASLPQLPQFYPTDKGVVRHSDGSVRYKVASHTLPPIDLEFSAVMAESGLQAHSSSEDANRIRRRPGPHYMIGLVLPEETTLNLTARDAFFFYMLQGKIQKHAQPTKSTLNFHFAITPEVDVDVQCKKLVVHVLDQESNQAGKNPAVVLGLQALQAKASSFASRAGVELRSKLSVKYGIVPDSGADDPVAPIENAAVSNLCEGVPVHFSLYKDEVGDNFATVINSIDLTVLGEELQAKLTVPFLLKTLPRLQAMGKLLQEVGNNIDFLLEHQETLADLHPLPAGGSDDDAKQEEEVRVPESVVSESVDPFAPVESKQAKEAKRPVGADIDDDDDESVLRTTSIKNSTGVTVWFHRAIDKRAVPVVLGDGQEIQVVLSDRPAHDKDIDSSESDFRLKVFLDGGWSPHLSVDLLPGFTSVQKLESQMGPSFLKLAQKSVGVQCESRLHKVHDDAGNVIETDLVVDLHSSVRVTNSTSDPVYCTDFILEPGQSSWLSVIASSTGTVAFRPTPDHSWTKPLRTELVPGVDPANEAGDLSVFQKADCCHVTSGIKWMYVTFTRFDAKTQVTHVDIRAPIQISNYLPFPITLRVVRAATRKNMTYFWDQYSKDPSSAPPAGLDSDNSDSELPDEHLNRRFFGGSDENNDDGLHGAALPPAKAARSASLKKILITHNVERGNLAVGGQWDVHGGHAFDRASVGIHAVDTEETRVDGFFSRKRIPLDEPTLLKSGWLLTDGQTNRTLRVFVVESVSDAKENRFYRHLRVFTHYTFVDRTNLQLRFSEDTLGYMTSHYMHPLKEAGKARERRVPVSSHYDRNSRRKLFVGTPHCSKWSPSLMIPTYEPDHDDSDDSEDEAAGFADEESWAYTAQVFSDLMSDENGKGPAGGAAATRSHVVRIPSSALFATPDPRHQGRSHPQLANNFCTEVVFSVSRPYGLLGPTQVICRPQCRIVNRLSCGIAIRQFADAAYRKGDVRSRELPMYLPGSSSSAFHFWDAADEREQHTAATNLSSLSFMPIFLQADEPPLNGKLSSSWEWSKLLPVERKREMVVSVHNTNLNRRMIFKVQVVVDGPHRLIVLSSQDPLALQYKVQNQMSQCSLRFSQYSWAAAAPDAPPRYWQTLHPGSVTVPFAWSNPLDGSEEDDVAQGVDENQKPFLLAVRIFTHKEIFETHVDLSKARLGSRVRLHLSGSRPDVVIQTRLEMSTGAVVAVASDYIPSKMSQSTLHTYEAEEKKFIMSLLTHDADDVNHLPDSASTMTLFPRVKDNQEPWRDQFDFGQVTFQLTSLSGVGFDESSSVYYVISYGKMSRRAVLFDQNTGRRRFDPLSFAYDRVHDPADVDYSHLYIDIYERSAVHGTVLRRTATLRDVDFLVSEAKGDRVQVETTLSVAHFSRVDGAPTKQTEGRLCVRMWSSSHSLHGVDSVPGRLQHRFRFLAPKIKLAIGDYPTHELLHGVSMAKGISLDDVVAKSQFLDIDLKDTEVTVGSTHSHFFLDVVLGELKVFKKFVDQGMGVGKLVLSSEPDHSRQEADGSVTAIPALTVSAVGEKDAISALDFAYAQPGVVNDTTHDVTHVNAVSVALDSLYCLVDKDVPFRMLSYLQTLGLFTEMLVPPSSPTTLVVDKLSWKESEVLVSFQTALPPQALASVLPDAPEVPLAVILEVPDSLDPRNCFGSVALPQGDAGLDDQALEEALGQDAPGASGAAGVELAPVDTLRGSVRVPRVDTTANLNWGSRRSSSAVVDTLRHALQQLYSSAGGVEAGMKHLPEWDQFQKQIKYFKEEVAKVQRGAAMELAAAREKQDEEEKKED